jgi:glycosyltransferase involved in cell wall biosynthesis
MPKILIVIARLNVGGTSQYVGELVHGLQARGYEVLVATGKVQGAEVEDEVVKRLPIERIKHLGRKISLFNDFRARSEIKKVIDSYRPALIYSHTFKAGALVRSLKNSVPVLHAFHGHLLTEPELAGWKSRVVVAIERALAPRSRVLVTVGKRVAKELLDERVGNEKQYISIAPGVRPLKLEDRDVARNVLGISDEKRPIVVWMARVTAVKAPQRVAHIARMIPEARFLLAGGGDLMDETSKDVPENLSIVGWQPAIRMWAVADLAISTSENEGMPVALIEAQLAGVPVVAIDVGSVGEVIIHGKTGLCVPSFNSDYVESVRQLIQDEKIRSMLGRASEREALRRFSVENLVSEHVRLLEQLLGR